MTELEEAKLLRKIVESGSVAPAPARIEHYAPYYEVVIAIGKDHTARVLIDEDAYFELMEGADFE